MKTTIAGGRSFRVNEDIFNWALDTMMAVTFDFSATKAMSTKQIAHLERKYPECVPPTSSDGIFVFDSISLDPELHACIYLVDSIGVAFDSNIPRWAHWWYLQRAESKKHTRVKQDLIKSNIARSLKRLETRSLERKMTCAVDQVLLREKERAEKRGVEPDFYQQAIQDEVSQNHSRWNLC